MRGIPFRLWVWLILEVGMLVGTVGWLGDIFGIRPGWFEVAGFVMVIPTAGYLWLTERRRLRERGRVS